MIIPVIYHWKIEIKAKVLFINLDAHHRNYAELCFCPTTVYHQANFTDLDAYRDYLNSLNCQSQYWWRRSFFVSLGWGRTDVPQVQYLCEFPHPIYADVGQSGWIFDPVVPATLVFELYLTLTDLHESLNYKKSSQWRASFLHHNVYYEIKSYLIYTFEGAERRAYFPTYEGVLQKESEQFTPAEGKPIQFDCIFFRTDDAQPLMQVQSIDIYAYPNAIEDFVLRTYGDPFPAVGVELYMPENFASAWLRTLYGAEVFWARNFPYVPVQRPPEHYFALPYLRDTFFDWKSLPPRDAQDTYRLPTPQQTSLRWIVRGQTTGFDMPFTTRRTTDNYPELAGWQRFRVLCFLGHPLHFRSTICAVDDFGRKWTRYYTPTHLDFYNPRCVTTLSRIERTPYTNAETKFSLQFAPYYFFPSPAIHAETYEVRKNQTVNFKPIF